MACIVLGVALSLARGWGMGVPLVGNTEKIMQNGEIINRFVVSYVHNEKKILIYLNLVIFFMAFIVINRKIATKFHLDKYSPRVTSGKSILSEQFNGDFEYETNDELKNIWDSLDESLQEFCIKCYIEDKKDLELIIEELKENAS